MAPPDSAGWSAPFAATVPSAALGVSFAKYYLTQNQSIPDNVETEVAFQGRTSESNQGYPTAGAQIALPYDGVYMVTGQVSFAAQNETDWGGQRYAHLEKQIGGVFTTIVDHHQWSMQRTGNQVPGGATANHIHYPDVGISQGHKEMLTFSDVVRATAGERLRVLVQHNSYDADTIDILGENEADNRGPRLTFLTIVHLGGLATQ